MFRGIMCGMARVRISTTVDSERLRRCRQAVSAPDSELIDLALAALEREVEQARERRILDVDPYEADFDPDWRPPSAPLDPYDGSVPKDVLTLARRRRRG